MDEWIFFSVDRGRHVNINQMLMPKAADQHTSMHTHTHTHTYKRNCIHTHTLHAGAMQTARTTNTVTEKCNAQKRKKKHRKITKINDNNKNKNSLHNSCIISDKILMPALSVCV